MKKLLSFTLVICLILACSISASCKDSSASANATIVYSSETMVVIKVDEVSGNATLIHAFDSVKGDNFNYEISGGMITSVNGVQNTADWSYCWMIYTNDADFSNSAWGFITHNGEEFGSAILGAESLPVTANCLYILNYTYFPPN